MPLSLRVDRVRGCSAVAGDEPIAVSQRKCEQAEIANEDETEAGPGKGQTIGP
jgi:hypothetical protein